MQDRLCACRGAGIDTLNCTSLAQSMSEYVGRPDESLARIAYSQPATDASPG